MELRTPQFMHIAPYPLNGRAPKPGRQFEQLWGVRNIIGEGLRLAGFCPHVEHPKPPVVNTLDAPVGNPLQFEEWITTTMATCQEESGARLRKNTLALGTAIISLPEDAPPEQAYDLRDLSEKFFTRWLRHHDVTVNYSVIHVDESCPHVHLWATPSRKQYENQRWKLSHAFQLPGKELRLLQDLFWQDVGKPLGLTRKGEFPRGRRFDRRTLRMLQVNPMLLRYSPQYEAGFINALDRIARFASLPPDLLFDVVRDELDEHSVDLLKERLVSKTVGESHYQLRETEIEAKPFIRSSSADLSN